MARLNEHDAQHSAQLEVESQLGILHNSGACQELLQTPLAPLQKSVSMDRSPHMQKEALKMLQQIQRSSSSSSVPKVPNSFPGSLSDKEGAAFRRPAGLLAEAGTIGRGSGSSLSSSIFGESNQWVIDYNDLVSNVTISVSSNTEHSLQAVKLFCVLCVPLVASLGTFPCGAVSVDTSEASSKLASLHVIT